MRAARHAAETGLCPSRRKPVPETYIANDKGVQKMSVVSMSARTLSAWEYEALQRAKIEHAENVAVRMNPHTFRIEYYDTKTGKVVSSHI